MSLLGLSSPMHTLHMTEEWTGAQGTPFVLAQPGQGRRRQLEEMKAAVRREGAASMRECSAFLRAAGSFAEFVRLLPLGRTEEAVRALHDALFENETAVLLTRDDGPFSQACAHGTVCVCCVHVYVQVACLKLEGKPCLLYVDQVHVSV